MMDDNSGLLTGLASAIRSGLDSYDREENRRRQIAEREMEQRAKKLSYDLDLRKSGLIQKPDGTLEEDPNSIAYQKSQAEMQMMQQKPALELREKGLIKTDTGYDYDPLKKRGMMADASYKEALAKKASAEAMMPKNMASPKLPPLIKAQVDPLIKDVAKMTTTRSMVNELLTQVADESIPENQRVATALEQLKLMNSALGPDALGEGETQRVGGYLSYKPDPFGPKGLKIGPDLKAFKKQVEMARDRLDGTINTLGSQVNKISGQEIIAGPGLLPKVETKMINGAQYKKVEGGWQRVK